MQITEPGTLYDKIGGEDIIKALSEHFYDVMETDPNAADILALHPEDLAETRIKFFEFLVGWMGGPQLYVNKYGHPRLRMRHMHVSINEIARDQWMYCMESAMKEVNLESSITEELRKAFYHLANFMRNTEES